MDINVSIRRCCHRRDSQVKVTVISGVLNANSGRANDAVINDTNGRNLEFHNVTHCTIHTDKDAGITRIQIEHTNIYFTRFLIFCWV